MSARKVRSTRIRGKILTQGQARIKWTILLKKFLSEKGQEGGFV
jgi:hypothetical protein